MGTSRTDSNCNGYICPFDIIPGISQLLLTQLGQYKVNERPRQGQGMVKAWSRQGQGSVKAGSRQGQDKARSM